MRKLVFCFSFFVVCLLPAGLSPAGFFLAYLYQAFFPEYFTCHRPILIPSGQALCSFPPDGKLFNQVGKENLLPHQRERTYNWNQLKPESGEVAFGATSSGREILSLYFSRRIKRS
ncbi:hypothetical protein ACD591_10825 [Rufibacter glacialis]|uniref:Uncharacterized protein n=1 Tax=Rufibacter glacialis TaxID=1259555 RepID=A0A5M8QB54_9BACT|nr:hypothetical protein [Rufibacter glacialis]KAA6431752.1 hypothetical protein FOE74_16670 [Rufibacter glacialis]